MRLENEIRRMEASDERQYMMNEDYEVYEKQGAPLGAVAFHYHNFYELLYVLEGEYSSMIEDKSYALKKGDFLLIDMNRMHKYQYEEGKHDSSKRIILWITPQMLESLGNGGPDLSACFRGHETYAFHFPIYYEELLQGYLLKLAMTKMQESGDAEMKKLMDRGVLTLFFTYLNVLCEKGEYRFAEGVLERDPMVEQVSDYIDRHLAEKITVDDLAKVAHMSKYYFLRKFKDITGMTAHSFLINKRLIHACELLKNGEGVTETYQMCGFADYTSFLRNFRETYGVAPGKYKEYYQA
ncbi:MAG: AraC family transcriptional regulator [Acetatifactor sp.]|nr:AraC family transcriptional regulator [Acetatifactor sp.]